MTPRCLGHHAIVVGGGLAGLLAARALAPRFRSVSVLDRDALADEPRARPCLPHSCHAGLLLAGGAEAVEQLVPGTLGELGASGGIQLDAGHDVRWCLTGTWLARTQTGVGIFAQSPGLLEWVVRRRTLAAHLNILVLSRHRVRRLIRSASTSASALVRRSSCTPHPGARGGAPCWCRRRAAAAC